MDFEHKFKFLLESIETVEEGELITILISEWTRQWPMEAMDYFANYGGMFVYADSYGIHPAHAVVSCSKHHPELAFEYYLNHREACGGGLSEMTQNLTRKGADLAWEWMKKLNPREQRMVMEDFFHTMIEEEPGKIGMYIDKVDFSQIRYSGNWEKVINQLTKANPAESGKWVAALSGEMGEYAGRKRLKVLASLDQALFSDEFASLSEKDKKVFLENEGYNLGDTMGYVQMSEWLLSQENSANLMSEEVMNSFLHSWQVSGEWEELLPWLEKLPEGEVKDLGISEYAKRRPFVDSEKNMQFIMQIKDEGKRNAALNQEWEQWHKESPEQAEKWMEKSGWTKVKQEKK